MIRAFKSSDMHVVLNIWLDASTQAHPFIGREFWESKLYDMRYNYLPASDTYVYADNKTIKGFLSLHGDTIAALFVSPDAQGQGIGSRFIDHAKSLRQRLNLAVYRENQKSLAFYEKRGFIAIEERVDEHTGHAELVMEYRR